MNMKVYNEDDFLMLSGIQHFTFCKRQWALIHIEQQWAENVRTVEGNHLHKRADQPMIREKRGNKLVVRGLPIHSRELGITGICDVVEFMQDSKGISLVNEKELYLPYPVEYKRGKPKTDESDILQLTAQAMCLEEMLMCEIQNGYLYYNEIKH
jgi:CRISPR-associated exonuclease Cas4